VDPALLVECGKPIREQKWAVVSFISPEDRIKQRTIYEMNRFLYHDVNKQIMDTTINTVKNTNEEFKKILQKNLQSYKFISD